MAVFSFMKDFKIPSNTTLKTPLVAVFDDLDIEVEEEDELKARGKIILLSHLCMALPISLGNCVMWKFQIPEVKGTLLKLMTKKEFTFVLLYL